MLKEPWSHLCQSTRQNRLLRGVGRWYWMDGPLLCVTWKGNVSVKGSTNILALFLLLLTVVALYKWPKVTRTHAFVGHSKAPFDVLVRAQLPFFVNVYIQCVPLNVGYCIKVTRNDFFLDRHEVAPRCHPSAEAPSDIPVVIGQGSTSNNVGSNQSPGMHNNSIPGPSVYRQQRFPLQHG